MLINTITGGQHEVRNIDHIRIKGHADGRWSLKIYPAPGDLLMPSGASMSEVDVSPEEVERIRTVAGHLIASIPPELKGDVQRGLAALDRLAADGQAWDADGQGEGNGSSGLTPLDPGDDPARHGQVVREGGKHYRL